MAWFSNQWKLNDVCHVTIKIAPDVMDVDFYDATVCTLFIEDMLKSFSLHKAPLYAYCVLVDHVHLITKFTAEPSKIMHTLKSHSANLINRHLGRAGAFWQPKSWDVIIRDKVHFINTCFYVWNNPVKAELVNAMGAYPFSNYLQMKDTIEKVATELFD